MLTGVKNLHPTFWGAEALSIAVHSFGKDNAILVFCHFFFLLFI